MRALILALLLSARMDFSFSNKIQKVIDHTKELLPRKSIDKVEPTGDSIVEVNRKRGITDNLFQGDMILSKEQQLHIVGDSHRSLYKRQAYNDKAYPSRRWFQGVFYLIDDELGVRAKTAFKKAANLWMKDTCIDFEQIEEKDLDNIDSFILVHEGIGIGCSSEVGRQDRGQTISLEGCETVGAAAHEIGHALGFFHTHSRYDRDQFVTVDAEHIDNIDLAEFEQETIETNNNYNLTYDYGSVMHYGATSGSYNGKLTMVPKDVMYTETLGSDIISFYDLLMMNMYYNCTDSCKDGFTLCQNGGFTHPRNCSKCICPSGYGGQFCEQRPPGCGQELNATRHWTELRDDPNAMQAGYQDGYKRCIYWIKAPNGTKVEVKIVELPDKVAVDGCVYAGVEIKAHPDTRRTGYRFCSKDDVNTTLTSNSSTVPLITYMRRKRNYTAIVLEYRYVEENLDVLSE